MLRNTLDLAATIRVHCTPKVTLAALTGFILFASGPAVGQSPCDTAESAIESARPMQRMGLAMEILAARCQPMPKFMSKVMNGSVWPDGAPVRGDQRVELVAQAIASGYDEPAQLVVEVLEGGKWPDDTAIDTHSGAQLVEALAPVLDEYRTGLLMDIYEQIPSPIVRTAVIGALANGVGDSALLPVVDAYWASSDNNLKVLAAETLSGLNTTAADELVRMAGSVPKGPALEWVIRLGSDFGVAKAVEIAKAR